MHKVRTRAHERHWLVTYTEPVISTFLHEKPNQDISSTLRTATRCTRFERGHTRDIGLSLTLNPSYQHSYMRSQIKTSAHFRKQSLKRAHLTSNTSVCSRPRSNSPWSESSGWSPGLSLCAPLLSSCSGTPANAIVGRGDGVFATDGSGGLGGLGGRPMRGFWREKIEPAKKTTRKSPHPSPARKVNQTTTESEPDSS